MGKNRGETYIVGCAHCGERVYQFVVGDKPVPDEVKNIPEHRCEQIKALHAGFLQDDYADG